MLRKAKKTDLKQISDLITSVMVKTFSDDYSPEIIAQWKKEFSLEKLESEFDKLIIFV